MDEDFMKEAVYPILFGVVIFFLYLLVRYIIIGTYMLLKYLYDLIYNLIETL